MYFSFPGRLIQFIDLGNGVWAKKKIRRNIIFCFICYNDWPAGCRKEVFFQFTDGSLTTINHSVQDAETFQNVNSRKHWIVSKQWIHLEEDRMVLLFLGFWYQDKDTKGGVQGWAMFPQFLISGQKYKGRFAGSRFTMAQNSGKGRDHRMFAVTFQIKSVLKHPNQGHHVNNPNIQRSSWDIVLLIDSKGPRNSFQVLPCVEKNQFLWQSSVLKDVECLHKSF